MNEKTDYIELIKRAQHGDRKSQNDLAEYARERLYIYVFRLVLSSAKTEDIVQECLLEMFKILGKLKKPDRFWPWLYGIALNKIKHQRRAQRRRKTIPMSELGSEVRFTQKDKQYGLEKMINRELGQLVSSAMRRLKMRHRAVLSMRCYEEMEYAEIAQSLGCSEFTARMSFSRAKRALERQLSRSGLGKGALLTALVIFGKMTAPSEAAAAKIAITAATTKVGLSAGIAEVVTSKAVAIPAATAAGVIAVGTLMPAAEVDTSTVYQIEEPIKQSVEEIVTPAVEVSKRSSEFWYYYPSSGNGAVMTKIISTNLKGKHPRCRYFQDEEANYFYNGFKNTIYIKNHRGWRRNLAVRRLPNDGPKLRQFLNLVEGVRDDMEYIPLESNGGVLVIVKRGNETGADYSPIIQRRDVL
ncbi:MAG: RNA polymerase sigma factor, partial [Planctomycetota bacterium]